MLGAKGFQVAKLGIPRSKRCAGGIGHGPATPGARDIEIQRTHAQALVVNQYQLASTVQHHVINTEIAVDETSLKA